MIALTIGRRYEERLMVDTCIIRSLIPSKTIDETSGEYLMTPDPNLPDPIYAGRCKFTAAALQVRDVDTQGQNRAITGATLSLPVEAAGSALVTKDHTAVITLARFDHLTITARVEAGHASTFATARRLPIEVTS